MQDIEKLRSEIDEIHLEMAQLFQRRLKLTEKIWQFKKDLGLALTDIHREHQIIHRFDHGTLDLTEQRAMQNFFQSILKETKTYLEARFK